MQSVYIIMVCLYATAKSAVIRKEYPTKPSNSLELIDYLLNNNHHSEYVEGVAIEDYNSKKNDYAGGPLFEDRIQLAPDLIKMKKVVPSKIPILDALLIASKLTAENARFEELFNLLSNIRPILTRKLEIIDELLDAALHLYQRTYLHKREKTPVRSTTNWDDSMILINY